MTRFRRPGITAIETALVLPIYFGIFLATVDLGMLVFRQHAIDHAATYAARIAIVHGENAASAGVWGPTTIDVPATASGIPIVAQVQDQLHCCDLEDTHILVEWLDGNNAIGSKVRVTITTVHSHLLSSLGSDKSLHAERTMLIEY